jgi:hypothetical protein
MGTGSQAKGRIDGLVARYLISSHVLEPAHSTALLFSSVDYRSWYLTDRVR